MPSPTFVRNLSKFRLITFDVTDTLLKFRVAPAIQYAKTASNFGYSDIDQEKLNICFRKEFKSMAAKHPNFGSDTNMDYKDWWRIFVVNVFNGVGANIPKADLQEIANTLIKQYRSEECWQKTEGADDLICKVKKLGKTVGVISNFDSSLHDIIKIMQFPSFNYIFTSYEVGVSKPNPKIFQQAAKRCGVKDNESLHIGNTPAEDYIGAVNAGWSSLHLTNSSDKWKDYPEINKNHVFKDIKCLLEALEQSDICW